MQKDLHDFLLEAWNQTEHGCISLVNIKVRAENEKEAKEKARKLVDRERFTVTHVTAA